MQLTVDFELSRSDNPSTVAVPATDTIPDAETIPLSTGGQTTEVVQSAACPEADGSSPQIQQFASAPPMCIDVTQTYVATLTTNIGVMTLTLDAKAAPVAVNSFVFLAGYHYFDDTPCHRIITGFVFQCGDPTGTGTGGPGYTFADELPRAGAYEIGSLAMANSGPDTNGSQFFVVTGDDGVALPPSYTLFGTVTAGLSVVAKIDALGSDSGEPSSPVNIESVTVATR